MRRFSFLFVSVFFLLMYTPVKEEGQAVKEQGRLDLAVFHELVPVLDQGGNIRIRRLLEDICASGMYRITLFIRDGGRGGSKITIHKQVVPILHFPEEENFENLDVSKFSIFITGMWFWRGEQEKRAQYSLATLVHRRLSNSAHRGIHFTITDDIHHVRFSKVLGEVSDFCADVMREEVSIWENPRIFKIFVSDQDMQLALDSSRMSPLTARVIPYTTESVLRKTTKPRQRKSGVQCTLTYFGNAHPANVIALRSLFHSATELIPEYYTRVHVDPCVLQIAGDNKWKDIVNSLNTKGLEDLGITVKVLGFVDSLDQLLSHTLVILPIVVSGTGVSTKVITCIERRIPFVSTNEGIRGFPCDDECRRLFFFNSTKDMLKAGILLARDQEHLSRSKKKLQHMMASFKPEHIVRDVLKGTSTNIKPRKHTSPLPYFTEQAQRTCAFCEAGDLCSQVCHIVVGRIRPPNFTAALSVFASVKGSNEEELQFISGYLENVFEQDFDLPWELVLASSDNRALVRLWKEIEQRQQPHNLQIKLVLLSHDPGLYETWDYIVSKHTSADVLQNWNLDDRKHFSALTVKFEALSKQETKLVSSTVLVSTKPNEVWSSAAQNHNTQKWFDMFEGYYGLHSMFQLTETSGLESLNLPHNSPMYARDLHHEYGSFSTRWYRPPLRQDMAPTCSDFNFWVQPLIKGETYYHLDVPVELYYVRLNSHNRASGASEHAECVQQVSNQAMPEGNREELAFQLILYLRSRIVIVVKASSFEDKNVAEGIIKAAMDQTYKGRMVYIASTSQVPVSLLPRMPPQTRFKTLKDMSQEYTVIQACILYKTKGMTISSLADHGIYSPHRSTFHVDSLEELHAALVKPFH